MAWVRLDDQMHAHPKINRAFADAPASLGLHTLAMTYSAAYNLDGFVDDVFVASKLTGRKTREKAVQALVNAGLWHRDDDRGGYEIHDWAAYNGDADAREAARRAKVEAGRKGAAARWQKDGTCHTSANGTPNGTANGKPVADDGSRTGTRAFPSPSPNPLPPDGGKDTARAPVRFRGKTIPQTTLVAAQAILADLNRQADTNYRPFNDQGAPSESLSRILGAILADQRITVTVGCRMTTLALAGDRYWEPKGRFHTGHVFGPGVREPFVDQAINTTPAMSPADEAKAFVAAMNRNAA